MKKTLLKGLAAILAGSSACGINKAETPPETYVYNTENQNDHDDDGMNDVEYAEMSPEKLLFLLIAGTVVLASGVTGIKLVKHLRHKNDQSPEVPPEHIHKEKIHTSSPSENQVKFQAEWDKLQISDDIYTQLIHTYLIESYLDKHPDKSQDFLKYDLFGYQDACATILLDLDKIIEKLYGMRDPVPIFLATEAIKTSKTLEEFKKVFHGLISYCESYLGEKLIFSDKGKGKLTIKRGPAVTKQITGDKDFNELLNAAENQQKIIDTYHI